MTQYLIFRLYAPLASWGEAAVGETRPSATYPGRSAILGLLGAALGIRRTDSERLEALAQSVSVAVKQCLPGTLLRDYHTVQVAAPQKHVRYRTRRDELSAPQRALHTILSSRDYRCDGLWHIALWARPDASIALPEIARALAKPKFVLYLGRKACPLGAPLAQRMETHACLRDALDCTFETITPADERAQRYGLGRSPAVHYVWEGDADTLDGDPRGVESSEVWDAPLSRIRWQFGTRQEHRRSVRAEEER